MDRCLLLPRRPLRPRGLVGLSLAGLGGFTLGLPGLFLILLLWSLVVALAATVLAFPVAAAGRVDPWVGSVAAGLLGLVTLPFAVLWLVAGCGAVLAWLASRTLGAPLALGEALSLGLRRALPFVGSAVVIKGLGLVALLPAAFLAAALALLRPEGSGGSGLDLTLQALGWPLTGLAAACGAYVCFRILWAPWSALLEGAGPLEAVERAWTLSRGQAGRALRLVLGAGLLAAIVTWGLAFLALGPGAAQAAALGSWLKGLGAKAGLGLDNLGMSLFIASRTPWPELLKRPDLISYSLLALALPAAAVGLTYAGLSAFFFDLLCRQEGFGTRARLRATPEAAPLPGSVPPQAGPDDGAPGGAEAEDRWPGGYEDEERDLEAAPEAEEVAVEAPDDVPGEWSSMAETDPAGTPPGAPSGADAAVGEAALGVAEAGHPEDPLDLGRIEGISLARGSEQAGTPKKGRLSWLWSWLPEPERPGPDGD